jgi:hypothetical protein
LPAEGATRAPLTAGYMARYAAMVTGAASGAVYKDIDEK